MALSGTPGLLAQTLAIYLAAGFVKGALGFGTPLISVALLSLFVPADTALAYNALVILATNLQQIGQAGEMRAGLAAAWPLMAGMAIAVPVGALFAAGVSKPVLLAILGSFVLIFVVSSFLRPTLRVPGGAERRIGFGMGLASGLVGAFTSSPGPVFLMYVVALHLPREVYMATLGFIMILFGFVLTASYVGVGVLRWEHVPVGLAVTVAAVSGMWLGNRFGRKLPAAAFRKAVLIVLGFLGAMMIRRALA